jgi:hypothetical protein
MWSRPLLLAAVASVVVMPAIGRAGCLPAVGLSPVDASAFISQVVDSLVVVQEGRARAVAREKPDASEKLLGLRELREHFECAAQMLAPFAASKDSGIYLGANQLIEAYRKAAATCAASFDLLVEALDADSGGQQVRAGTFAKRAADVKHDFKDAFTEVAYGALAATQAIKSRTPDDPTTLLITEAQREKMKQTLTTRFDARVKAGLDANNEPILVAGTVVYVFLSDARWKSLDEPRQERNP